MKHFHCHAYVLFRRWLTAFLLLLATGLAAQEPDTVPPPPEEMPPAVDIAPAGEGEKEDLETDYTGFWVRELWADEAVLPPRRLSDSARAALADDKDFWYADGNIHAKKKKEAGQSYTPVGERSWFQTLVWLIIIGGFGVFLVIWLSGNNIRLFRRRPPPVALSGDEAMPEDIFAIRYEDEIRKALAREDYRLAVRLHFLKILRLLADRQLIRYQHDKTNLEFLLQVRSRSWYDAFFRATRHFEFAWYGQFAVDAGAYQAIADTMNDLERKIIST
jgi:hypothetical protein